MTDIAADAEAPADLWMVMAIIQPFKLDSVTLAVEALPWLNGMTVTKCTGLRNPGLSGELTGGGAAFGARPAGDGKVFLYTLGFASQIRALETQG